MLRPRDRSRGGISGASSPPPPFTPSDISGLLRWYDAKDTATVINTLGLVDQWSDKSTNAAHMTNTLAARPLYNGTDTISTDGVATYLFNALPCLYAAGATTLFIVMKSAGSVAGTALVCEGSSSSANPVYQLPRARPSALDDGTYVQFRNDAGTVMLGGTSGLGCNIFDDVKEILTIADSGSLVTGYINGVVGTTPQSYTRSGTNTMNRFAVGVAVRNTITGFIAANVHEIIAYDSVLSDTNKNLVGNYLATKHSLTWTNI